MFLFEHTPQLSITDLKVKWPLCFAFSQLNSITNEEQQSGSAINPVTTGKYRQFPFTFTNIGKPCHALCYHKSTPCAVSKKKWDTKEDKGKSMMCTLYILQYAKSYVLGQSDIKQGNNQTCRIRCYRVTLA